MSEQKTYSLNELKNDLNEKQKKFAHQYCMDWNATRSYKAAYPDEKTDNTAGAAGNRLLRNVKIQQYIEYIKTDYEFLCGISKARNVDELRKIAFSTIAHLHNTWITLKEFEDLTDDQKASIESIDSKIEIRKGPEGEEIEVKWIKIKLYNKKDAIAELNKMMGYNEPEKVDLSTKGKEIKLTFGDD